MNDKQDGSEDNKEDHCAQNSVIMLTSTDTSQDIAILDKNIDLSSLPLNYLRRRSTIEDLVYRAGASETQKKSPFASFKMANDCIDHMENIDIITGIKSLKSMLKMPFTDEEQVSIMVHRIGNTWLVDAFDVDSFFIELQRSQEWQWFRNFLIQRNFHLCQPDFSRSALISRDLYGKFLYHCVAGDSSHLLQLPANTAEPGVMPVHDKPIPSQRYSSSSDHRRQRVEEEHLQYSEWRVKDLSFLVGSDLAIFGTKTHPCISLKLNHYRKPINVLTGIDLWLENIINEVPEVAMCFHNEGIVMQDYQIFRTEDIPNQSGFEERELRNIARNLVVFLRRNATKDGHTYWLFREKGSEVVKLYDLTTLTENSSNGAARDDQKEDREEGKNPFVLPVAILCYRMAERRVQQHRKMTPREVKNESREQYTSYLADVFRLLRNCINILSTPCVDQTAELRARATLLLFQLYLEAKPAELAASLNTIQEPEHLAQETSLNVDQLLKSQEEDDETSVQETSNVVTSVEILPGDFIFNAFKSKDSDRIMQLALTAVDEAHRPSLSMIECSSKAPLSWPSIEEDVRLVLVHILMTRAEVALETVTREKTSASPPVSSSHLNGALKDAYFAYLLLQNIPSCNSERRVLEVFSTLFLTVTDLSQTSPLTTSSTTSPEQDYALRILRNHPSIFKLIPETSAHLTQDYHCTLAVVKALRRLHQLPCYKSTGPSLLLALNLFVNALVKHQCSNSWLPDGPGWEDTLSLTLSWLAESVATSQRVQPQLAAVLCCGQAKLLRLAASVCREGLQVERYLEEAVAAYDKARDVLRKRNTASGLWDNISHDRLVTGIDWHDRIFRRVWSSTEPNTDLLKTAINLISDLIKRETLTTSDRTLVPLTILKVRHVSSTWLLAWKKQRQFPHETMIRELRESYEVVSDREDLTIEVFIILSYLVMIEASQKDVLSSKSLHSILVDSLKAKLPLEKLISQSDGETNEMIDIHVEMLTNQILAVAQRLVQKSKTAASKSVGKSSKSERLKQLYGSLLKAKATPSDKGTSLILMLNHISDFLSSLGDPSE